MPDDLKSRLPRCGLFRTTQPLPGHEAQVGAGMLVYFHNHSDSGLPQVVLADHSVHNRWHFHGPGIPFRALSWAASLHKLPEQGFYVLRKNLTFSGGNWPRLTLVQLGYSRAGDPVAFIAQQHARLERNELFFADRGVSLRVEQLALLEGPIQVHREPAGVDDHAADLSH